MDEVRGSHKKGNKMRDRCKGVQQQWMIKTLMGFCENNKDMVYLLR